MTTCGRLFGASKVYAYYDAAKKQVTISADVTVRGGEDVHICPNPIAVRPSHEFLVIGTTSDGIHPQFVVIRRLSYSFPADQMPKSVIVYSAGVDAPMRQVVQVSSLPPGLIADPPADVPQTDAPQTDAPQTDGSQADAKPSPGAVEVTGYSPTFSFEQAVQDALAQATAKFPVPPRNPDVAVDIDIKDIFARTGGNIRPGLFVRATAK